MTPLPHSPPANRPRSPCNRPPSLPPISRPGLPWVVGLIQAGVVGSGIRSVARMGERREQQHAERHEETMEVLRQQGEALRMLIERTAPGKGEER